MRLAPILALALMLPASAEAASFNCDLTNLAPDEQVICHYRDINDMDVEMATMYRMLTGLFAMGMRGVMQDDQHAWLQGRMACGADADCIRNAYRQRIDALQATYDSIDRPI